MHTLLVTSAVAGEGKTTVACNLALGLEKKGYSVLLLDADLRKPAVCRTIQLDSGTEGAYEVLTGQRTAEEVKSAVGIHSSMSLQERKACHPRSRSLEQGKSQRS